MDVDYGSLSSTALFIIQFSCDPANVEAINEQVHQVLINIQKNSDDSFVTNKDIDTMKEIIVNKHELRLKNNSNWLFWMLDSKKMQSFLSSGGGSKGDADNVKTTTWLETHLYQRQQGYIDFVLTLKKEDIVNFANIVLNMRKYRINMLMDREILE